MPRAANANADSEHEVPGVPVGESLLFFGFGLQRICCVLTMRLLMTWLTADSVNAVEMAAPARWRSP